jgi:hypothetical protein
MGEYTSRAKGRLTTGRADHETDMRDLAQRTLDAVELGAHFTQRWAEHMGQFNNVLETGTAAIDANGAYERTYRVPFASIAVINGSCAPITVSPTGRNVQPGTGAGTFTVPPRSYGRMPLVGGAVTFYGTSGAVFSYTVLAAPATPQASAMGTGYGQANPAASVGSSVTSVQLVAANVNRVGLVLYNASLNPANVSLAGGDAAVSFSLVMPSLGLYTMNPVSGKRVTAAWPAGVDGSMLVTEVI